MAATLNPYLSFRDNAREAMEFYQAALGGDLESNTFGEYGDPDAPEANLIMHARLNTPAGFTLMGADTPPGMEHTPGTNITVSLSGEDSAELRGYWEKLSVGGSVTMPLGPAPWGDTFGMCTDKFGVNWLVDIAAPGTSGGAPST